MRTLLALGVVLAASAPALAQPSPQAPPPADDSCRVKVTGGVAREAVGRGGLMAISTSHWTMRDGKRSDLFKGVDGAQINCNAPDATITISIEKEIGKFPLGPGRYETKPVKRDQAAEVTVLGTIDKMSLMQPVGAVEVTAYDGSHIAGTFKLTGKTLPGDKAVTVEGQFAFKCPGLPGCAK